MADSRGEKIDTASSTPSRDVEGLESGQTTQEVVLSKHGLRLHPQPVVNDPLDPLNWSTLRKHTILAIVMSL